LAYRSTEYGNHFIQKINDHATVEYEGRQHFIKDIDYNYEEEEQIKLMYKAVYQLNDIEKHWFYVSRG
jgi:hypothetical protein